MSKIKTVIDLLKMAGIDYSKMAGKVDPNKIKQLVTQTQKTSTKQDLSPKKVNIEVLKKRVFEERKRERFQSRVLVAMFCLSIVILGYIVV